MRYIILAIILCFSLNGVAQSNYEKGLQSFNKENYNTAKSYFQAYLKENPNHKQTKEYLGDIAGHSKDWDTALDYYKELLDASPKNANYHFKYGGSLGLKCLEMNKVKAVFYIDDIKYHLNEAAKLDPNHIEVRWALVELYIQLPGILGKSESKSQEYAEQLYKISPVDGHLSRGYIAEYSNRPKDAEVHYKKAIEIGGSPHTYEKLTKLYEENNEPEKAVNTLEDSLKKYDRNQLNYQIAKICAQYNIKPQTGLVYADRYIQNHSIKDGVPLDWAYLRKAQMYRHMGNRSKASYWIQEALKDRSDFKEALQERSLILDM